MFGSCFFIQYFMSFLFCNRLDGEERTGSFTLIGFLVSCDCKCSVTHAHGIVGWFTCCWHSTESSHKLQCVFKIDSY